MTTPTPTPGQAAHSRWHEVRWPGSTAESRAWEWEILSPLAKAAHEAAAVEYESAELAEAKRVLAEARGVTGRFLSVYGGVELPAFARDLAGSLSRILDVGPDGECEDARRDAEADDDGERDTARRMDAADEAARLEAGL